MATDGSYPNSEAFTNNYKNNQKKRKYLLAGDKVVADDGSTEPKVTTKGSNESQMATAKPL
jgi:hypothetical protein